jgi:hypothetical protein
VENFHLSTKALLADKKSRHTAIQSQLLISSMNKWAGDDDTIDKPLRDINHHYMSLKTFIEDHASDGVESSAAPSIIPCI